MYFQHGVASFNRSPAIIIFFVLISVRSNIVAPRIVGKIRASRGVTCRNSISSGTFSLRYSLIIMQLAPLTKAEYDTTENEKVKLT